MSEHAPTPDQTSPTVGRLAGNTIVQVGGNLLASALGFLTFVAVTRGLGSAGFGDLTTALVFLTLPVVLADVGLSTALLREISARPERTEPAMRAALPLRAGISALAVALAVAVGLALPFSPGTHEAIAIGGAGAFFTLMSFSLVPVLQAQLRMEWAILGTVVGRVLTLAATVAALQAGYGLGAVMGANVLGLGVTFAVHLVAVARLVSLRPVIDTTYWRRLVRGSIVVGLALALGQIYFRVDTLLLAAIRDPTEVGLYGAAFKFIELAELVGAAVGISVFPLLARLVAIDVPRARQLLRRALDILLAAAAPLVVLFLLRPTEIVVAVSGSQFEEGGDALRILAPYVVLSFVASILWRLLIAWGDDVRVLGAAAVLLVTNVTLNLVLIPEYGFRAAAWVSIGTETLSVAMLALIAWRRHRVTASLAYLRTVVPAAALMALILVAVPLHVALAAPLAGAAYVVALAVLPGTVKHVVHTSLLPTLLRAAGRRPAP